MAMERWIVLQGGHLHLVVELDGAAYLAARSAGRPYRWVTPTTLEALVREYGEGSRLVADARAALEDTP
jgi:hypothetical protein